MKSLLTIFTFIFTVMFLSTSFAKWTEVVKGGDSMNSGDIFFIDFEQIRKVDGYVYFWGLTNYLKPTRNGRFSSKYYKQGDCKLFRFKFLSFSFHNEPMGGGIGDVINPKNPEWNYPPPKSVSGKLLESVCS